ncbi:response regulator [Flavobacterium franklandianum]|uniref:histidine kinase n=1 Tax=Flavobacterium franklandianum TaxID=2594430 RepID=A0A553CLV9_9FLAO|nr:response regulator [Flavobacterium franklandianum]TRX21558.1 response regulator [Flavobacterium franklandianum]
MPQIRLFLLLILLTTLNSFSTISFAQTKTPSKLEIRNTVKRAVKYLNSEKFEKSLETARLSLNNATIIKDDYFIAVSYNIIAANFDALSEFDKAIFFYKKGLTYANKTKNDTIKNYLNNNLGNVYCFEKKEYQKGINYYKKSLEYSQKVSDTTQIVFTKLNIAWAYFDIGQYENGLPYLQYINKYHAKFGDETTIVIFNMLNGIYSNHIGADKTAESYFLTAISLGKKFGEKNDLAFSNQEYSKFLLKKGDYKKAYESLVIYHKITEEIYSEGLLKKANVAGINLELDEYKREIDRIETENVLQAQSLKKSRIIVVLFVMVFLVLLMLLYSLYKNYNFKKKANYDLTLSNAELLIAKDKAEEGSRAKTQFVSTISHELRTPLYGVIGITNLLLDEHKELAKSPHLNSLKFSARYLLSLVNDILQINKIEENRIILEILTFNLSDEIKLVKNALSFISQSHKNKISVKIDSAIPEYLIGDKLRLAQILMNLVSNALKFTKNGEVIISADLVKVENNLHHIEFQISDNGVGIEAADQDKIFDKFVQLGRNDTDYQGTGLGLSIVKRLLGLFNSEISLESQVGVGTTFIFTIAFEYDPEKTNEIINNINVDLSSGQIFKVLVVEDNKINQTITKKIIEKNNCSCFIVDDGFQALDVLEKDVFDVILMDINMPLISGFETTRKIRLKGIQTPIIALTAFAKDEITEEALDAGMNDIIIKPFESIKLFQVINNQIIKAKNAVL